MNINLRKIFNKYKIIIVFSVIVGISSLYFLSNKGNIQEGFAAIPTTFQHIDGKDMKTIDYSVFYDLKDGRAVTLKLGNSDGSIDNTEADNFKIYKNNFRLNYGSVELNSQTYHKIVWEEFLFRTGEFDKYMQFKKVLGVDWRNDVIKNNEISKTDIASKFTKFNDDTEKTDITSYNGKNFKLPKQYIPLTKTDVKNKYIKGEITEKSKIIDLSTNSLEIPLEYFDGSNALYNYIKDAIETERNTVESKYYWYEKKGKIIGPLTKKNLTNRFIKKKLQDHHIVYRSTGNSNHLNAIDKENGKRLREIGMQYLVKDSSGNSFMEYDPTDNEPEFDRKKNATTNLYSKLNRDIDEKRKETAWMYDDADAINKRDTITDINHPYFGSFKNVTKDNCVDDKGNCKTGLYQHGDKCLFEKAFWGFEDKNICYPLSCKDGYNPNKRCKVTYENQDIPKCFNEFKCNPEGTKLILDRDQKPTAAQFLEKYFRSKNLTDAQWDNWLNSPLGQRYVDEIKNTSPYNEMITLDDSNQKNYMKRFLVDGNPTNIDRLYPKHKTKCACDCKNDWHGDDCSKKLTYQNKCDGATDTPYCQVSEEEKEVVQPIDPYLLIYITIGIVVIVVLFFLVYFGVLGKIAAAASVVKKKIASKMS